MTGSIGNTGNFHFRFTQGQVASNSANSSAQPRAGANGKVAVCSQQAKATPDTASPAQPNSNLPANAATITAAVDDDADASQSAAATAAAPGAQNTISEGLASSTPPQWLGKRAAIDAANDDANNSDTAMSNAAIPATTAATANPATSIAAVTTPNAIADAPPSADNASAAGLAIGAQLRARAGLARLGSQNSQTVQTGQQSASTPDAANAPAGAVPAKPDASAHTSAATPPPSEASAQSTPANGARLPQGEAAATTDFTAADAGPAVAAPPAAGSGPANPQNATAAVQSATANLPTFAVATAAAATGQAAAAASAGAPGTTVPVAGLPIVIAARAQAGVNQFDIRLDPPELGRIDVRLGVDGNGQVTSHVTVDRPETLTLLQSQQPQLERALEQAGLKTADNGLQFSLRDQSFAGGNSGGGAQPTPAQQQLVIPDADASPVEISQTYSGWSLGTGVDIRV